MYVDKGVASSLLDFSIITDRGDGMHKTLSVCGPVWIHLCINGVTLTEDGLLYYGFLLGVELILDTSFSGGLRILIQLNNPAELTLSDNGRAVVIKINMMKQFLPEASFGLLVLSSPASVCVSACVSVCVSITCLSAR